MNVRPLYVGGEMGFGGIIGVAVVGKVRARSRSNRTDHGHPAWALWIKPKGLHGWRTRHGHSGSKLKEPHRLAHPPSPSALCPRCSHRASRDHTKGAARWVVSRALCSLPHPQLLGARCPCDVAARVRLRRPRPPEGPLPPAGRQGHHRATRIHALACLPPPLPMRAATLLAATAAEPLRLPCPDPHALPTAVML
eukprot:1857730-Prymnesium_polylepis.1